MAIYNKFGKFLALGCVLLAAADASAIVLPSTSVTVQTSAATYDARDNRLSYSHDVQTASGAIGTTSSSLGQYSGAGYIGSDYILPLDWQATSQGQANATAHYGDLHAFASASMQYWPSSISYVGSDTQQTWYNPLKPSAGASATADFYDILNLDSLTLRRGTQVTVKFSLFLDSQVQGCDPTGDYWRTSRASASFGFTDYRTFNRQGYVGDTLSLTNSGCDSQGSREADFMATLAVGSSYVLHDHLNAYTSIDQYECSPYNCGLKTFLADASHTSLFYVDILTPDVLLTTGSGHDYATPSASADVPEPGSLPLAMAGLPLLALVRRRPGGKCHRADENCH